MTLSAESSPSLSFNFLFTFHPVRTLQAKIFTSAAEEDQQFNIKTVKCSSNDPGVIILELICCLSKYLLIVNCKTPRQ